MGETTRWHITEILKGLRPPRGMLPDRYRDRYAAGGGPMAWKTGTSYGFRDAWAIGYTDAYTVGVWIGRPDGTPSPGHYGARTAAPVLFQVAEQLGGKNSVGGAPVDPAMTLYPRNLPPGLKYLGQNEIRVQASSATPPPRIMFPLDGTAWSCQMPAAASCSKPPEGGGLIPGS